jgi:hypothetical protein
MADTLDVDGRTPAHESNDFVALSEQQLSEIRAVLAGDSRNQSALGH